MFLGDAKRPQHRERKDKDTDNNNDGDESSMTAQQEVLLPSPWARLGGSPKAHDEGKKPPPSYRCFRMIGSMYLWL